MLDDGVVVGTVLMRSGDQLDLGTSPSIKYRSPPTELNRLARLAGRVIENALESVTIDMPMK